VATLDTTPPNKSRTTSYFLGSDVPVLLRLPLADHGDEGKEIRRAVMCRSSGGRNTCSPVHVRGAEQ
jgi:hypothetical protein